MPVTWKMNMQHFLFVLLKRPLNASREKRYINTRILLERERKSIPPSLGEQAAFGWGRGWRGLAMGRAPAKRQGGVSLVLSLQTW